MAISFVQSKTSDSTNNYVNSISATFTSNVSAGSLLLAFIDTTSTNDETTATLTDTNGNTWTRLVNFANTTDASTIQCWYVLNANAGATQVNYLMSANFRQRTMGILEFSGVATTSAVDGTPTTTAVNGYTQTHGSGNLTTTNANDLIIGAMGGNNGDATLTSESGQGWGSSLIQAGYTGSFSKLGIQYKIVAATGTYQSTFIDTTQYMTSANMITAFKEASAGPSPSPSSAVTTLPGQSQFFFGL